MVLIESRATFQTQQETHLLEKSRDIVPRFESKQWVSGKTNNEFNASAVLCIVFVERVHSIEEPYR